MKKYDKKARVKEWREQQRDTERKTLPLPGAEMELLFDMLDVELPKHGCAHSRRLTDAWIMSRGYDLDRVHAWLDQHGGFCDCEVLANSEEAWRFASGRD